MLDLLESRRLLSVTVTANEHILRIEADNTGNRVEIALYKKDQAQIFVGGVLAETFKLADFRGVAFAGGSGADVLIMGRTPLKVYADGGDGNDAISASRAALDDTLLGNSGNDYLYGGPGDDLIDGGGGDDGLFGDAGDDTLKILSDAAGDDTVTGGEGFDTIDTSNYNRGVHLRIGDRTPAVLTVDDFVFEDVEQILGTGYDDNIANVSGRPITVFLGKGNDTFTGGRGNETVFGGRGNDRIATYGGRDLIVDQEGANNINGGSGSDTAIVKLVDLNTETTDVERLLDDTSSLRPA